METILVFLGGALVGLLVASMKRPTWTVTWIDGQRTFTDKTSAEAFAVQRAIYTRASVTVHGPHEYVIRR
jgi:hypothetical protein